MLAKSFTILAANWAYHFEMGVYASSVDRSIVSNCRQSVFVCNDNHNNVNCDIRKALLPGILVVTAF